LLFIRKDKNLTAPLTFILSRKGREENKKEYPLTLPSPAGLRGKKDEKILTAPLTFVLSRRGREEMKGKILKAPLTLPSPTWLCHNPCFACDYAKNTVKNN
jgi:hypothetical protein